MFVRRGEAAVEGPTGQEPLSTVLARQLSAAEAISSMTVAPKSTNPMPIQPSKINIGDFAAVSHTFLQTDFDRFAALSGDDNPIHVDPAFAASTRFGSTVAHGMFLYSHASAVLRSQLPGSDFIQHSVELMFPFPTFIGEAVEFRVEVEGVDQGGDGIDLRVTVTRPKGESGLVGRARMVRKGARLENNPSPPEKKPTAQTHKGLRLGQTAEKTRVFTSADLEEFTDLIGDKVGLIVAEGLLGGLISTLLGTTLPGRGTNWLKQNFQFLDFAEMGEPVTASVEIIRLRPEKNLVNLQTMCSVRGRVLCVGEALVFVKDLIAG